MIELWTKNKSEITDAEYEEFYKYIGHSPDAPAYRLHFNADAPLSIRALLFVPAKSFEHFTMTRDESDVSLYCKKILIQPKACPAQRLNYKPTLYKTDSSALQAQKPRAR